MAKRKQNNVVGQVNFKELHKIAQGFFNLAENLESEMNRRGPLPEDYHQRDREKSKRWRREWLYAVNAGWLLTKAIEFGGFPTDHRLRSIAKIRMEFINPDVGRGKCFEWICLRWASAQPDGFDYVWKCKQKGKVQASADVMRLLGKHLEIFLSGKLETSCNQ